MADSARSPAFQFYPRDFLADEHVRIMDSTARGVYITLLCVCWLEGSIPADDRSIQRLGDCTSDEWKRIRDDVLVCFTQNGDGRYHHKRLDKERQKQAEYAEKQADAGKVGAQARWRKHGKRMRPPCDRHSDPNAIAMAKNGSASSSASASASSSSLASSASAPVPSSAIAAGDGFDAFWQNYPKKVGKGDAAKVWRTMQPGTDLQARIVEAVGKQRSCRQWLKDGGQYIPNPATWLRQKRWDDDPDPDGPIFGGVTAHNLAVGAAWLKEKEGQ